MGGLNGERKEYYREEERVSKCIFGRVVGGGNACWVHVSGGGGNCAHLNEVYTSEILLASISLPIPQRSI